MMVICSLTYLKGHVEKLASYLWQKYIFGYIYIYYLGIGLQESVLDTRQVNYQINKWMNSSCQLVFRLFCECLDVISSCLFVRLHKHRGPLLKIMSLIKKCHHSIFLVMLSVIFFVYFFLFLVGLLWNVYFMSHQWRIKNIYACVELIWKLCSKFFLAWFLMVMLCVRYYPYRPDLHTNTNKMLRNRYKIQNINDNKQLIKRKSVHFDGFLVKVMC